jgi:hypothetical protein
LPARLVITLSPKAGYVRRACGGRECADTLVLSGTACAREV